METAGVTHKDGVCCSLTDFPEYMVLSRKSGQDLPLLLGRLMRGIVIRVRDVGGLGMRCILCRRDVFQTWVIGISKCQADNMWDWASSVEPTGSWLLRQMTLMRGARNRRV